MPSDLTDGYSLSAQIPASLMQTVFRSTFAQQLPGTTATTGGRSLTLWFRGASATLTLLPKPLPFVNPIQVEIPFLARLDGEFDEIGGTVRIKTELSQLEVGSGPGSYIAPVVDFRTTAPDAIALLGVDDAHRPVWGPAITEVVRGSLARISPFTAGPMLPDRSAQVFLNTDPNASFGSGTGILGVYVWSEPGDPPAPPLAIRPRRIDATRAVALVPRDRVERAIDDGLRANGLRNLPVVIQDQEITAFGIEWREFGVGDGHFYIHGTVDGGVFDVDFEAWVKLFVSGGNVQVNVIRTKADTGFLGDVLDLFSGGAITRTLEEVLPKAVAGIGGGAFGGLGLFAEGAVPDAGAFATMSVTGNIAIWPDGLGIPASLVPRPVTSTFPDPVYLKGHGASKEFHVADCRYGRLIKRPVKFTTWQQAVGRGFNGCWHCQPQFNVVASGILRVQVVGVPPELDEQAYPKVSAELVSAVERFGVAVRPDREPFSGNTGWDEPTQTRTYRCGPLVPGTWKVTIRHGDWTAHGTIDVGKAWTAADGTAHGTESVLSARVGSSDVTVETLPRT